MVVSLHVHNGCHPFLVQVVTFLTWEVSDKNLHSYPTLLARRSSNMLIFGEQCNNHTKEN